MEAFDNWVTWVSSTAFYRRYVSNWPAPFNEVSFDAVILIVLLALAVKAIISGISAARFRIRFKEKQRLLREKEANDRLRNKEKEDEKELLDQYIRFIMFAQIKQMTSAMGLTFEQWKEMMAKADSGELVPDEPLSRDSDPDAPGVENPVSHRDAESEQGSNPETEEREQTQEMDEEESEFQEEDSDPDTVGVKNPEPHQDTESSVTDTEHLLIPEISVSHIEIPMVESVDEEPEPEIIDRIDIKSIVDSKRDEAVITAETTNEFFSVLDTIKHTRTEKELMDEYLKQESEVKEHNLKALDIKVEKTFKVEGDKAAVPDEETVMELDADFEKRKARALKKEDKEARKQEKREERSRHKARKQS